MKKMLCTVALGLAVIQTGFAFQKDVNMSQEFLKAVTQGDVARVKEMLEADAELARVRDDKGVSAILKAIYSGKQGVAAVLLASGIELNVFEAAAAGQTMRVRDLISADASRVNAFASDGFMPLGLAVFFGHPDVVEVLLAAGADVNLASREAMKVTPLHSAAASRRAGIARLLIAHGANVNARAENGFTPLHEAAANGDMEFAKLLLDRGADINAKTIDGKTPLTFALDGKRTDIAGFLRDRGGSQ